MKPYRIYLCFFVFCTGSLVMQSGCKKMEGFNTPISDDKSKPLPVTDIKVSNFSGGAYITYTLPSSKNILYVAADYAINDNATRQTKASYYSDSITVSGFEKSKDYQVTLTTVSRAGVASDPVTVTVHPETPPYLLVRESLKAQPDFGGINIAALNPGRFNIGVMLTAVDPITKKMEVVNQQFTSKDTINYSIRGYDTLQRQFGVYITDQWGNVSDTLVADFKPIYETQMDKKLFQVYTLPNSDASIHGSWVLRNMWDGVANPEGTGWSTTIPSNRWPAVVSFDMGQSARLSRFWIMNRGLSDLNYLWSGGAASPMAVWGRNDTPVDEVLPSRLDSMPAIGGSTQGGWIYMGAYYAPPKPSGLPNPQYTNEDKDFWYKGLDFTLPLTLPKVRYVRLQNLASMDGGNTYFQFMEITFWGDNRK